MTWSAWAQRRPDTRVLHLDAAAGGRSSYATLDAVVAHARREAEEGVYVAQAAAEPVVQGLREGLGTLFGIDPDGVVLVSGAEHALATLLDAWPLADRATVGVLPSEWGPNLDAFVDRGYQPTTLPTDPGGVLDLDAFGDLLRRDPPAAVHLVAVPAHRGLTQPVREAGALCRASGVPLWVDAAQAVGQVTSLDGADAAYGTSRKWLCGPRGLGFLGVRRDAWPALRLRSHPRQGDAAPLIRTIEQGESHVAGRVGLAVAVSELLEDGPELVAERLAVVGRATRTALAGVPGWEVVPGQTGPITALRPVAGQDVAGVRQALLERHGILSTASLPWRAPLELTGAWLRVSPHVDTGDADLERLAKALADES